MPLMIPIVVIQRRRRIVLRQSSLVLVLVLLLLFSRNNAFSPLDTHSQHHQHTTWRRDPAVSASLREEETTTVSPPEESTAPPKKKRTEFSLELDSDSGQLRFRDGNNNNKENDDKVLLKGLSPQTWSTTTTTTDSSTTTSSLFLHTNYPLAQSEHETRLGDLMTCHRLLACARLTRYWMGPAVGHTAHDIPLDTQFLLIQVEPEGPYALFLPLVDDVHGFRASLYYDALQQNVLVFMAESGDANVKCRDSVRALYVAVGDDPFALVKQGLQDVAQETGTFQTLDQKVLPPHVDHFGWCTWDAFYSRVTPEGILEGVQSLRNIGTPPKLLILDDGWQQTTPKPPPLLPPATASGEQQEANNNNNNNINNWSLSGLAVRGIAKYYDAFVKRAPNGSKGNRIWKWLSQSILKQSLWNFFDTETDFNRQLAGFDANPKFEDSENGKSLKSLVAELKHNLEVETVYCWHALHGYWRGISPELGQAAGLNVTHLIPKPSNSLLKLEPQLAWDTVSLFGVGLLSSPDDLTKFYEKLHTPLVEAGVDGVKVDVQSGVSAVGGGIGGGPHLAKLYTNAMEASVSKRFQASNGAANCINCMCHSTENLYRYRTTAVARASEDFFPDKQEAHTVHLINVAYNSLFIGEIALCDWDMFHSDNPAAALHAASRAVGGCPVYVSDKPTKHNPDILKKLVLPDGKVLRAKLPGRPTRDCLFVDVTREPVALKIWNQNVHGGVVGAFNVQGVAWNFETHENVVLNAAPPPATAQVKPFDIETLRDHDEEEQAFVAWSHQSRELHFLPSGDSFVAGTIDHQDYEIYTIVPVQSSSSSSSSSSNNNKEEDLLLWAPIGLVNMFNSGGAILGAPPPERVSSESNTTIVRVSCRGPGDFVAFTNRAPSMVTLEDGASLEFSYDEQKSELFITLPEEIDGLAHLMTVRWED